MEGPMTKMERWLLKRIAKRIVQQGPDHKKNITEYYNIMANALVYQFNEDTIPELDGFQDDCYAAGRYWPTQMR